MMSVTVLIMLWMISPVQAQVTVVRTGEENPMVTIAKSTLYGAATGVILGLALSLAVDEDFGDVMKWSFVGGTLGGFFIGVYHVATRSQPSSALLQFNETGFARVALPTPVLRVSKDRSLDLRVSLVSLTL
jgi:uncharacterized membrane protein YdcZ (DUF606 family)